VRAAATRVSTALVLRSMVRMGWPVRFRPGGSTPKLTSGNAGGSLSGAVAADHIRIGMGCEGSTRRQSANSPAHQQLWPRSITCGSSLAGRIAVTQHITGPSASACCARARGRRRGHADPGVAADGPLGWSKAVTGGSPDRFLDGRPWVRSVRNCRPLGGRGLVRVRVLRSQCSFTGSLLGLLAVAPSMIGGWRWRPAVA
jgi:hypothetical protein